MEHQQADRSAPSAASRARPKPGHALGAGRMPPWQAYGLAVLAVGATLLLRQALGVAFGDRPLLILFVFPVIISAHMGGLGPGLVATAVAALSVDYWLIPPKGSFLMDSRADLAQWLMFLVSGALVCVLTEALHRARALAERGNLWQGVTLASIGDAVLTTDRQGRVSFINDAAQRLTGWSEAQGRARPLAEVAAIVDEATRRPIRHSFPGGFADDPAWRPRGDYLLLDRRGGATPITASLSPIRRDDGQELGMVLTMRDRTGQREAEERIRWLAQFPAQNPNPVLRINAQGELLFANQAAQRMMEGVVEGQESLNAHGLPLPWLEFAARARSEGASLRREVKRGQEVYSLTFTPAQGEEVNIYALEMTDLWRTQKRLHLALLAAKAGAWEWDLRTNENVWSEELWRLYGLEPGSRQPTYEVWLETVHPADRELAARTVYEAATNQTELNAEWRTLDADGGERWLMSRGQPLRDAQGQVVRYLGVVMDITERKRDQEALRETGELLREMSQMAHIGGWQFDPATGRGTWTEEVAAIHDLDPHQEPSTELGLDFFQGPWRLEIQEAVREAVELGKPYDLELQMVTAQGREKWVRTIGLPLSQEGRVVKVRGAIQDITEAKLSELALKDSLAEKEALLREVHHRVKNNLQIVASLLSLQAGQTKSAAAAEALRDTRNRVHSMALLHEVLYRSGNLARINFAVYTEDLCRHLLRAFGETAARVTLEQRIAHLGLPMEQSVPCGLIITELVSNALKHAFPPPRAGRIVVSLEPEADNLLRLGVADDGVGLTHGLDLSRYDTLGLKLLSNLALQLGGKLKADGPARGGAVFSLVFPAGYDLLH